MNNLNNSNAVLVLVPALFGDGRSVDGAYRFRSSLEMSRVISKLNSILLTKIGYINICSDISVARSCFLDACKINADLFFFKKSAMT
jgi:hypothetical protein